MLTDRRTELKLLYVYEILKLNYYLLVQVSLGGSVEATSQKIAGSITIGVTNFSLTYSFRWSMWSTQLLTEMCTRNISFR